MYRHFHKGFTIRLEDGRRVALNFDHYVKLLDDSLEKLKTKVDEYLKNL